MPCTGVEDVGELGDTAAGVAGGGIEDGGTTACGPKNAVMAPQGTAGHHPPTTAQATKRPTVTPLK